MQAYHCAQMAQVCVWRNNRLNSFKRIDYIVEKYIISERSEPPHITSQWQKVIAKCQENQLHSEERLLLAMSSVDYVTSFELPFRLMLVRAPQLIDRLREKSEIFCTPAKMNGNRRGVVYSRFAGFSAPDEFQYRRTYKVFRNVAEDGTTASYHSITKQSDVPRERLRLALTSGLLVTALDALLFFGVQRIASDVAFLRKQGMHINLLHVSVFDSLTRTVRDIPAYVS
jgi:hypothetical protein